jgi:hypothetical protein
MPGQFRGVATAPSISRCSPPLQYGSDWLTVAFIVQCDYAPSPIFLVQRLNDPLRGLVYRLAEILHTVCQRGRRILANKILVEEKHVSR